MACPTGSAGFERLALEGLAAHGGQLWEQSWLGPGFRVCNAMDPEGNLFQLREPLSA